MKNFQSITRSISSKGRISILLVLFLLLLNPQRSICQTGINQSFTLEWSISNAGVTLFPCVSSFSAIATYDENIPIGSVITIVAPDGFTVEGDFITNASGSNEFNFTYSAFSGTTLTFDCFVTWPDGTVVEAEFSGPPSLNVSPASNLVTIFEGAPNPIEFYGQSNVSFSSLNPTTFNRSVKVRILSNEITEIFVAYADEIDVNATTTSTEGVVQVQNLPIEGGYKFYTFNQTVSLIECPEVANTAGLTITINCADGTSQSYTQILNAEYIIDPPDFTTSNFEFAPSSNTTVGCPGNYVLSFDLNKSNSTTINLQDIIVPYNSDLYTLVSIACDGQDLSTIQTNGYESSNSQISVICTFTLNCSYFQTCSGVQDFLMYFSQDGIQIRYKSVCAPFIEYTKTANSITIGSEQTVVLLGGPTENSFTDTNQPIVLSYQLMLGAETNYGLSADAQVCSSIKYHVVSTLNQPTAFVGAGLSVQNVTGGYYIINSSSSSVEFELTNPDFNEYIWI